MSSISARRLAAEGIGTLFLLATVVGSGIMAAKLAGDSIGLALLCNAIATGAILYVLILILGPISGAHFNPAVTLVMCMRRALSASDGVAFVAAQLLGGIAGVWMAHAMFNLPVLQTSVTVRTGLDQWLAEAVATFGLIFTILGAVRYRAESVPAAVGLYILAAYWFTASTSFANPAVTIARALSNTFAGIAPADVAPFIVAQIAGALLAGLLGGWLFADDTSKSPS